MKRAAPYTTTIRYALLMNLVSSLCTSAPVASPPAYRETVTTPHWTWVRRHSAGTVKALFLVNNLALREPDELAERFDIKAVTIPAGGDPYKNTYDEGVLTRELTNHFDVIVVAAKYPWRDLSEDARQAIHTAVSNGVPLVCFGCGRDFGPPWASWLNPAARPVAVAKATGLIPLEEFPWRQRPKLREICVGKGTVTLVANYATHFTFFTAFLPRPEPLFGSSIPAEVAYAAAVQIIRHAAGKEATDGLHGARIEWTPLQLGEASVLLVTPAQPSGHGATLTWTLYDPFGRSIREGRAKWDAKAGAFALRILPEYAGDLVCRLRLDAADGKTLDVGLAPLRVVSPCTLASLETPADIPEGSGVPVSWTLDTNAPGAAVRVHARVTDADGRVVTAMTVPAAVETLALPSWRARYVGHTLDVLLIDGNRVLDEHRRPLEVRLNRSRDLTEMQVPLWGTEQGAWPERWRYDLLRDFGITALAPIGIRTNVVRMASSAGLRVVPTNIFAPTDNADENLRRQQRLGEYAQFLAAYTPVGYSLADEPHGTNVLAWRQLGADIIHAHDPGGRVGFCGTQSTDPALYACCDYITPYSPQHLYTPNLWLGVERDIYRGIRRPGGILTCWTHYVPWLDHEPYARTVPWLWLFEGMNGVSYFQSASNFGVLSSDLTPTHETRWWSEELRELHRGAAAQLLGMQRDAGQVRILHRPNARGAEPWVRALNRANIPYRFISVAQLEQGLGKSIRLLICPDVPDVSPTALSAVGTALSNGCYVVVTSPFAARSGDAPAAPDRLLPLFGIRRADTSGSNVLAKAWKRYGSVPTTVNWTGVSASLTGETAGEAGFTSPGAQTVGRFERLGTAVRASRESAPDFVNALFETPAVTEKRYGLGRAVYLAFYPNLATVSNLLPLLTAAAHVDAPPESVQSQQLDPGVIYIYPFSRGSVRLVGVVADYARISPTWQLNGDNRKKTAAYFHHGPLRWTAVNAVLHTTRDVHVYNVRTGRYLGYGNATAFKLDPTRPALFALLPYRVDAVELDAPSSSRPGGTIPVGIQLRTRGGKPGDHVIHVELADPAGKSLPADRYNVWAEAGKATLDVPVPYNATAGVWRVHARDVLTGHTTEKPIRIDPAGEPLPHWRPQPRPVVQRESLDWPAGTWQPYTNPGTSTNRVYVSASQVNTANIRGIKYLRGGFTLRNALETYTLKYLASNDPQKTGVDDPSRIAAPYPPGFGFTKPRANMWYYNGYLNVYLDEFRATLFAVTNIAEVAAQPNGRVDMTWDTPVASLRLSTVMMPDHSGLFQELAIRPKTAFGKLKVRFSSYPAGFGYDTILQTVEQEHHSWVLLGNQAKDRAYGQGLGTGGMLVLPEEWKSVAFGRNTTLEKLVDESIIASGRGLTAIDAATLPPRMNVESDGGVDAHPASPVADRPVLPETTVHWVLWIFPDLSNADALRYMREHSLDTRKRLIDLFAIRLPTQPTDEDTQ